MCSPGTSGGSAAIVGRSPGRLPVGVLGVGALALAGLTAGPAGLLACLSVLVTGTILGRQALADRRRQSALVDIVAGIRLLGRELRSGADPTVAVDNARSAARGDGALVLGELSRLARDAFPGAEVIADPPMQSVIDDAHPSVQAAARLRTGWLLTRRHGVAFTPFIEALAVDLSQQRAAEAERSGQVAGPRMSGYVMAVLPLLGLVLGAGMGADPVAVLLGSGVGHALLRIGVALTCAGLLWSARIIRP